MKSLAVRYRPTTFDEVIGQNAIKEVLQIQVVANRLKNAYLFAGPSGCGKTTIARLFAYEINKQVSIEDGSYYSSEPIEIDAASNSGVDNVRNIIADASAKSLDSKYKVYIIDEAQGLSSSAWQAFLKCIEEPPEYTIFIFCTTDPQKIPDTILNRVMRFNFVRLSPTCIYNRLVDICKIENFVNYEETCAYIAKISNGGMRDAIAMLEKVSDYSTDFSIDKTLTVLGNYSYESMFELLDAVIRGEVAGEQKIIQIIEDLYSSGSDLKAFIEQFLSFCLEIDKYIIFNDISMTTIPAIYSEKLKTEFKSDDLRYYSYILNKLIALKRDLKYDSEVRVTIEASLLGIARLEN